MIVADKNQHGTQFGSAGPARSSVGASCAQCEAMLADLLDGTLNEKERAAFELHRADCSACDQMLADARRGAEMLGLLRQVRPEPRPDLLDRIFAATTGADLAVAASDSPLATTSASGIRAAAGISSASATHTAAGIPSAADTTATHGPLTAPHATGRVLPFRQPTGAASGSAGARFSASLRRITLTMAQPRLAMTAAMAFFSIALTLNLTGVRLSALKASDLRPAALERSFYQANARVVRYYENLRVVYELESRVRELQRANDGSPNGLSNGIQDGGSPNAPVEPERAAPTQDSPSNGGAAKPSAQPHSGSKSGSGTSQRQSLVPPPYRLAAFRSQPQQHRVRQIHLLSAAMVAHRHSLNHTGMIPAYATCDRSQEGLLV